MLAPSASTTRSAGSSRRRSALSTLPCTPTHRRADRLELAQDLERREVARVQEQVRARDPLDAGVRQPPGTPRQVRVGYDGDQDAAAAVTHA